jgi:hypothetical protein
VSVRGVTIVQAVAVSLKVSSVQLESTIFLCCIQANTSADEYAMRMRQLGKYHGRGIHCWETGQCSFHPLRVCTCGQCEYEDDQLSCPGKDYASKNVVTCLLHALAYEIECETRAESACSVFHP